VATGDAGILEARLRAQLLTDHSGRSPAAVVRHLLAIQAQDGRGARLAIRARSRGLRSAEVDEALGRKELVVSWLNRGTLHLVAAEDYWWLHPLTTPQLATGNARRLRQEGVTPAQAEQAMEVIAAAVGAGPQTRTALRAFLDAAGIPTAGQAVVHVLVAATIRGIVVRGPMIGNDHAFVSVDAWLGSAPSPVDRADALARLASRYLAGHAPASAEDLAKWAGITLADARLGLAAADEVEGRLEGRDGVRVASLPAPLLLGPFDPLLHGWVSRGPVVGAHRAVVTTNGVFRAVALVGGTVVATWSLANGVVTIAPLEPIADGDLGALADDAADVLRYLDLPDRPAVVGHSGPDRSLG
jgi:Winged helix DNA-binding domain